MQSNWVIFLILLFLSAPFSCTPKLIVKNESDHDSTVIMSIGDSLNVRLKSNPTTGYNWEISSIDTSIIINDSSLYEAKKVSKQVVGSGGTSIFYFQAVKTGDTFIQLIYRRPFEKKVAPIKTFKLYINVN